MTRLPKYEKETIIVWNEMETTASICTYNAGLRKRLEAFNQKFPELCRKESAWHKGGVSFQIDKTRLSVRLIPPTTRSADSKPVLKAETIVSAVKHGRTRILAILSREYRRTRYFKR